MMRILLLPMITAACLMAFAMSAHAGTGQVSKTPMDIPVYGKFEMDVHADLKTRNPYDPALGSIEASFTAPSGKVGKVSCFWYVGPDGEGVWKVRFTPDEAGQWRFSIASETPKGTKELRSGVFTAVPSEDPGFVRVSRRDPRYFEFDNGTAYYPIGENLCWYGNGKLEDYEKWMAGLKGNGVNYIRLWMGSWSFALEWKDTGLGNYGNRQDRAYQLDQVFALAEKYGMKVMLCLNNHGLFSNRTNPEWDNNPYNVDNGGFLESPLGFFVNPRAKDLFKRRLKYIISRWGYSPALHSWELFNEVDLVDDYDSGIMTAWHEEMGKAIRGMDPYRHPISTSFSDTNKDPAIWKLDIIDYTQTHFYRKGDMPDMVRDRINEKLKFGKPTFISEYALNWTGEGLDTEDITGIQIHQGQWGSLMSSAGGGAMLWWWDNYVDPHDLYFRFKGASRFAAGIDWIGEGFKPVRNATLTGGNGGKPEYPVKGQGLVGKDMAMAWVRDAKYDSNSETEGEYDGPRFKGLQLGLKGAVPGRYRLEWWDTVSGEILKLTVGYTEAIAGEDGILKMTVPEFTKDLAVKAYLVK